jgi:hypothetical protein
MLIVEAIKKGYCTISSARAAIKSARITVSDQNHSGRMMDLDYLLMHMHPVHAIGNLVTDKFLQEEEEELKLVENEALDLDVFSVLLDEDLPNDDDEPSSPGMNQEQPNQGGERLSGEYTMEGKNQDNFNSKLDAEFKIVSSAPELENNFDEEDFELTVQSRDKCLEKSLKVLSSFQTISTDLRITNLLNKLEQFQDGVGNPPTRSQSQGLSGLSSRKTGQDIEFDPRRAFLVDTPWQSSSGKSTDFDLRAAVVGLDSKDEAAATVTAQLMRKLRYDGKTPTTATELSEFRKVVRLIRRLQQAFATAGIHPRNLFDRFVPRDEDAKSGPFLSSSTEFLDLVAFQWLLAGIGYHLNPDDTYIVKAVFCEDGNALIHINGGGGSNVNIAGKTRMLPKKEQPHENLAQKIHHKSKSLLDLHRGQRLLQEKVLIVDVAHLLVCLDTIPPSRPPRMNLDGGKLLLSLFTCNTSLDVVNLSVTIPKQDDTISGDKPDPSACPITGAKYKKYNGTSDCHGCPNRNAALLALLATFIEGQMDSARNLMSHSKTASEALALLIRSFRTKAEMVSGLSAAVSGRPNHGSPDGANFASGGDTQRALTSLASITKRLSLVQSVTAEVSQTESIQHDLLNARTILKHLSTLVLVRRENEGCDSKGNFQYLLGKSGAITSAMAILMLNVDDSKLGLPKTSTCKCFDDLVCARHAASGFILSMLSSGTSTEVINMVKPYLADLVRIDFDLSGPGVHHHSGYVYVIAALIRLSPEISSSVPQHILNKWAHFVKVVKFEDDIKLHADSFAYWNLFEHLLIGSPVPFPHLQAQIFKIAASSGIFHFHLDHSYQGPLSSHPTVIKHRNIFAKCLTLPFEPILDHVDEKNKRKSNSNQLLRTGAPTTYHYCVASFVQGIRIAAYAAKGSDIGANDVGSKCAEMCPIDILIYGLKDMVTMSLGRKVAGHDARLHFNRRSINGQSETEDCKVGQEFSLHRGYGLTVLPWGYTRGLRAFSLFLHHVYLRRAAPFGSVEADTPAKWMGPGRLSGSNATSATVWPIAMLRPRQVHDLLLWAAECANVIKKFTLFLKKHAKFIATTSGRAVFTADKAACKKRQHHVKVEDLTDPAGPTRDTFILIFEGLLPCLEALHIYSRADHTAAVTVNNRGSAAPSLERVSSDSYRSSTGGTQNAGLMTGHHIGPLMAVAHTKAWSAIGGALFDLLDSRSLTKHMECICGAICPEFKHFFERYMLPQARKFLERLSMDSLVDFDLVTLSSNLGENTEGIDEEDEDEDVGSDDGNRGSVNGNDDEDSIDNVYCSGDVCYNFIDERQLMESQDLYELNTDPVYHKTIDCRSTLFGSTISSLHSGGLAVNNIPYSICSASKLSALLKRFGKIKSVIIRTMAWRSKMSSSTEDSEEGAPLSGQGAASVYFEIPNEKQYFSKSPFTVPTLSGNDDLDDGLEVDDYSSDLSVKLICLPTGSVAENFTVSPDERIITVLSRISTEITRAVNVLDMRVSVNGQEIRRNFKMSSIVKYAVDLEDQSSPAPTTTSSSSSSLFSSSISSSKLAERKQHVVGFGASEEKTPSEPTQRTIQIAVTWNSSLAAARCLDGVDPAFLIESLKPPIDPATGSRTKTNLPPLFNAPIEDQSTTSSISRLKSTSSYSSLSSDATVGAHVHFLDVPRRKVGGVSILVEDSGLDTFWRRFAAAAQSCTYFASEISKEFDGLVDFILNIEKISDFGLPLVVDTLIEYLAETYRGVPKTNETAQPEKNRNFWECSSTKLPNNNNDEEEEEDDGTDLQSMYGGYTKEILCYFVMLLLTRLSERAEVDKPYPVGVKWEKIVPPAIKKSLSNVNKPKTGSDDQGVSMDDLTKTVIPEKDLIDIPPSEVVKKQMQALLVASSAGSALVRVISATQPHSLSLKQALLLSIQLLDGGNHKGQENLHKMISVQKRSSFVDNLCHVCNLSKEFHDKKASVQYLLGITHKNPHTRKLPLTSDILDKVIHHRTLVPVSLVLDSSVFTTQTSDLVNVDRNTIKENLNELPVVQVLRLAQLMCEGHFKGMQDLLREGVGGALVSSTISSSSFTTRWMMDLTSSHRSTLLSCNVALLK